MKSEIKSLTSLRGIAALFIVITHANLRFVNEYDFTGLTQIITKSYLWVDFFFILSGFVIAIGYGKYFSGEFQANNYLRYIIRRIGRLYPLHIATLLAAIVLEGSKYIVSTYKSAPFTDFNPGSIINHVLLIHGWGFEDTSKWNGPSWSVSTEWAASLLFPFMLLAVFKMDRRLWPVIPILYAVGLYLITLASGNGTLAVIYPFAAALWRCLLSFSIGIFIFRLARTPNLAWFKFVSGDILAFSGLALIFILMHLGFNDILIVLLMAWLVFAASQNNGLFARMLEFRALHFLGVVSYSIYMVHDPTIRVLGQVWIRLFDATPTIFEVWLFLSTVLATVVGVSWISFKLIEAPGRRWVYAHGDRRFGRP